MKKVTYYVLFLVVLGVVGYFVFTNFEINSNASNLENQQTNNTRERDNEGFVYETEAQSPDECSVHEQFDAENGVCFFECANEAECAEISNAIDAEFAGWTDELEKDNGKVEEKTIAENDKSLQAEYIVSSGEKISLESGKDNEKFRKIWEEIAELSPDSLSNNYIEKYQIFDNKSDDTLAFVDDEDGNGKWRVAVNLAGYNTSTERENKSTFIHELAHIISLNTSQVNSNADENNCPTFFLDEGCTKNNSYLYNFQKTFWTGVKKNSEGAAEFDENKYVTEYATTNEVEDLAESFAFFVLGKEGEPNTPTKNAKVNYFYNYPELVQIRKDMRNVLAKDIVRAKKMVR
jgi:hypothetical protein